MFRYVSVCGILDEEIRKFQVPVPNNWAINWLCFDNLGVILCVFMLTKLLRRTTDFILEFL